MKTYIKNQEGWFEALETVYSMTKSISSNDKLYQNYSQERLKIDEWVALSIFNGGFSSVSHRSIWNNNCRILNRFFKLPTYRFENLKREVSKETITAVSCVNISCYCCTVCAGFVCYASFGAL